jgi:hypothetical protein
MLVSYIQLLTKGSITSKYRATFTVAAWPQALIVLHVISVKIGTTIIFVSLILFKVAMLALVLVDESV